MAERFEAVYSDEQRDAVASAYNDRKITPARRIAAMAAAGELDGLPPFTVPVPTVLDLARKQRLRRAGEHTSELAKQPPRDAVEQLRRRIVNVADRMVTDLEKQKPGQVDPDRVRQAARAIRECAAIPGPTDPTPAKPGHVRDPDGKQSEGATTRGPVGVLLTAARRGEAQTAPDQPTTSDTASNETTHDAADDAAHDNGAAQPTSDSDQDQDHTSPGQYARAQLGAA